MASGVLETFIDVLIIAMPIGMVLRLQLSTRKKVSIAAVFILGAL
jgi:hypothetical protein